MRIALEKSAKQVRDDVDAEAVANQFITMSSYAALLGSPLGRGAGGCGGGAALRDLGVR